ARAATPREARAPRTLWGSRGGERALERGELVPAPALDRSHAVARADRIRLGRAGADRGQPGAGAAGSLDATLVVVPDRDELGAAVLERHAQVRLRAAQRGQGAHSRGVLH